METTRLKEVLGAIAKVGGFFPVSLAFLVLVAAHRVGVGLTAEVIDI